MLVFMMAFSFASFPANAQNPSPVSTPTTPKPKATPDLQPPVPAAGDPLYAPVVTSRGPQSLHERFMDYAIVTVGPRSLFVPPVYAAIRMIGRPHIRAIGGWGRARLAGITGPLSRPELRWRRGGS